MQYPNSQDQESWPWIRFCTRKLRVAKILIDPFGHLATKHEHELANRGSVGAERLSVSLPRILGHLCKPSKARLLLFFVKKKKYINVQRTSHMKTITDLAQLNAAAYRANKPEQSAVIPLLIILITS